MALDDDASPTFDLAPEELRRLGHAVVDFLVDHSTDDARDPVLPAVSSAELHARLDSPPPRTGRPFDELLAEVRDVLAPARRRNGHPGFFAYVCGSADPFGALFEALAAGLHQNVTAWRSAPAATEIERLVVRWLGELVGFGEDAHGLLTSGGSAANLTALASALAAAEHRTGRPRAELAVYVSREGHVSLAKAFRLLGLPAANVRTIEVDQGRRMRADDLARALDADAGGPLAPACVCATAGTANTGAIDPLEAIADACAEHGVWLHVDGAYGAPAAMTEAYAWLRPSFARADSLILDPHKWLFAPLGVGCALVRDAAASRAAFAQDAEYLTVSQSEPRERFAFFEHGLELSRRWRALSVWGILSVRGADAIADVVVRNIRLRERIDARVAAEPDLEPLGSGLSIACFRWCPEERRNAAPDVAIDAVNRSILETLARGGRFLMSPTTLEGRYALRVCMTNFRTREEDVDSLADEIVRLGTECAASLGGRSS